VDQQTKIYLTRKFREYYASSKLEMPPEFQRREWAFVPFEVLPNFVMFRHISFESEDEFKAYILGNVPAHIYYSSAYYKSPSAEKMELKGWKGADLIFDIDADHLPVKTRSMQVALKVAKREIIRLADILISDFGIRKKDMEIVFSGSRGYHLHVHDRKFRALGSAERREIVDYLTLNDVNLLNGVKMADTSQAKRVAKCMTAFFVNAIRKNNLNEILNKYGIKGKTAERVLSALSNRNNLKLMASGNLTFLPKSKKVRAMIDSILSICTSKVSVHIDAPVTADVKRLIRFPGSLHGKTGLRVTPIKLSKIEEFDPFQDAIVFGEEKVKVRAKGKIKENIGGEKIKLSAGEKALVPEYIAVFLLCRGMAVYGH